MPNDQLGLADLTDAATAARIKELVRVLNVEIIEATRRGLLINLSAYETVEFGSLPSPTVEVLISRPL
jgi:hypothetical protein